MRERRKRKLRLFWAAVLLCLGVSACLLPQKSSLIRQGVTAVTLPLRRGAACVQGWIQTGKSYLTGYEELKKENEQLRAELAAMEKAVRQGEKAEAENQRLRTLLNLRDSQGETVLETAQVLSREKTAWHDILTVTIGSDSLAEPGDWVITENNALVGQIAETGPGWATVRTVLDPETEVSVIVSETSEVGLASSSLSELTDGTLTLTGLQPTCKTSVGNKLETSGLNGLCQAGLLVGTVEGLLLSSGGLEKAATIAPAADLDSLEEVFLIIDWEGQP